jgi:hypothetical protein
MNRKAIIVIVILAVGLGLTATGYFYWKSSSEKKRQEIEAEKEKEAASQKAEEIKEKFREVLERNGGVKAPSGSLNADENTLNQPQVQVPPETIECLSSSLGLDTILKIKSGAKVSSGEIGDKIAGCLEGVTVTLNNGESPMSIKDASPKVFQCVKSSIGEIIIEQIKTGKSQSEQEIQSRIQSCF